MSYFWYILALLLLGYSVRRLVSDAEQRGFDSYHEPSEKALHEAWSSGFERGVKSVA